MDNCKLSRVFNRLKKSSSDSIDNTEKFDSFKDYMHVTRAAESDLKSILRSVNNSGKKTLVLLCGSAGDGKSHLLSYLKNADEEHLIENYRIFNDATESSAPSKTAIETLNELLSAFKDENIEKPGQNVILAINLGVLSNFVESEYRADYSLLRKYVDETNILTTQVNMNDYDENSHFQHVSFSDYHMYSLTENGIHAGYIEDIFAKVFSDNTDNVFYKAYLDTCAECPLAKRCPVKMNYEFLCSKSRRKYVANLLVETIIKDKTILTTREILNFIHNIVVSQEFSYTKFQSLQSDEASYLREFMKQITPSLLFDSTDVAVLMNMLNKYDPLLARSEDADEDAISYYVSADVTSEVLDSFSDSPYKQVLCDAGMVNRINLDKTLKSAVFNLIVREKALDNKTKVDEIYRGYLKDLYSYNSGLGKKLGNLYGMIEKAVTQWCGSDEDGNLCLDNKHDGFAVYESVQLEPNLDSIPVQSGDDELQRFMPSIIASFDGNKGDVIDLDIDYALYELLYRLNKGYIQTADDRNNHADFISFVERILQTGNLNKQVTVMMPNGKKATISSGHFGYKFRVV
ncbi:DNA phosphorothioation-dependent restriction protein DptF [Lachnospiraceae bacterium XBD2001]|nr:DNA phosphorothioation-dependent restriction protein DptF [Lachnospiraceae bacterium XBD2001]